MTTTDHLGSLPFSGDTSSFPTHAELTRTLLGEGGFATLTTTTSTGFPYGSLVAYSVLDDGSPLVCISEFAEHTKNARRSPNAGLFVAAPTTDGVDPMDAARVSIVGTLALFEPEVAAIDRHLAVHPGAAEYVDWNDFNWWRLAIEAARYLGGFGAMSWIDAIQVAESEADPIIRTARPAIDHMNADHADANLLIVRHLGGVGAATAARVRDIDRHGMTFYADTPDGLHAARVAFVDGPLSEPDQVRGAVVALTHAARSAGGVA